MDSSGESSRDPDRDNVRHVMDTHYDADPTSPSATTPPRSSPATPTPKRDYQEGGGLQRVRRRACGANRRQPVGPLRVRRDLHPHPRRRVYTPRPGILPDETDTGRPARRRQHQPNDRATPTPTWMHGHARLQRRDPGHEPAQPHHATYRGGPHDTHLRTLVLAGAGRHARGRRRRHRCGAGPDGPRRQRPRSPWATPPTTSPTPRPSTWSPADHVVLVSPVAEEVVPPTATEVERGEGRRPQAGHARRPRPVVGQGVEAARSSSTGRHSDGSSPTETSVPPSRWPPRTRVSSSATSTSSRSAGRPRAAPTVTTSRRSGRAWVRDAMVPPTAESSGRAERGNRAEPGAGPHPRRGDAERPTLEEELAGRAIGDCLGRLAAARPQRPRRRPSSRP